MKWTLLLIVLGISPALAHEGESLSVGCERGSRAEQTVKRQFPGGFTLHIKSNIPPTEDGDNTCTGILTDKAGKVLVKSTGFHFYLDEENSKTDFDGDGKPDLVLRSNTVGWNQCCRYHVVSMTAKPKIYEFADGGLLEIKKDAKGKAMIVRMEGGPIDFTAMANRPFAWRVLQIQNGKVADVTAKHCSDLTQAKFFQDHEEQLTKEALSEFKSKSSNEEMRQAVLSNAMQMLFCKKTAEAKRYVGYFPDAEQAKVRTALKL